MESYFNASICALTFVSRILQTVHESSSQAKIFVIKAFVVELQELLENTSMRFPRALSECHLLLIKVDRRMNFTSVQRKCIMYGS